MDSSIMVLAVPVFMILILVEFYASFRNKTDRYNLNDSLNNISTGIVEEIAALPMKIVILVVYHYLYLHYGYWQLDGSTWISWFVAWIGVDFCYYWFHRCSHRCAFLWIGHSVHHQSTYYNLSVALRQGVVQAMTSWVFFLPLAMLGVSPIVFGIMYTFNTIYQFWIHTQSIQQLGWLEKVFNTPSHHRVHHGTNPQYIDKNYAGSLIIWDKLFGTFEPEDEAVTYGVTDPLDSWNPFYANIKVIKDVLFYSHYLPTWHEKILAFIMPPEWVVNAAGRANSTIYKPLHSPNLKTISTLKQISLTVLAIGLYFILMTQYQTNLVVCTAALLPLLGTLYWQGKIADGNKGPLVIIPSSIA
ncbi:sterol desaturase family protein [Legionella sp. W05-934-2]|uniref:sterol desaturase family protein n=1 Tax=Legionella sp. W05-934-2 TaxID=1198649 RepID=UPI0034617BCE